MKRGLPGFLRRAGVVGVAVALMVASFVLAQRASRPSTPSPPGARPNVVLIVGCTVRADQLTPYGGHPDVSPFLASRAAEGVRFDRGVSAAPWTRAAVSALVTGRHAADVGMVEPSARPSRRRLAEELVTLAEVFRAGGYQTFGATANPNLNRIFGFGQGFDVYVEGSELWRLGGASIPGKRLVDLAQPAMRDARDPSRPLYAQFVFTDAHFPPAARDREESARFRGPGVSRRVATYRAMLRRFDDTVRGLEHWLGRRGLTREDTVFSVVNDHGEGLFQPLAHGKGHGRTTYASAARMPWILWGRGVAWGHRVGGMASGLDVGPTLAGLAGLSWPDAHGMDWSAAVRGETDRTTRERAFVDTWFQEARRTGVYTPQGSCHEDYGEPPQMVRPPGSPSPIRRVPRACYEDDALERPWIGPDADAVLTALDAEHRRLDEAFEAFPHKADAEPQERLRAELEALGYVQDDDPDAEDAP